MGVVAVAVAVVVEMSAAFAGAGRARARRLGGTVSFILRGPRDGLGVLEGQVKGNISGERCGVRTRHGTFFAVVIPRATCRCRILRNYEGPLRKIGLEWRGGNKFPEPRKVTSG